MCCSIYTCMHAQTFKHAITHMLTFKHAIACIYKNLSMQSCSNYISNTPSNAMQHMRKSPGGGRIKHLVPPCISGMQLFEAEHVSIRADSMHQLLPKRQQISPLAHPKPSNTQPVDTHHSHRSFSQEGRLIYFSTSVL